MSQRQEMLLKSHPPTAKLLGGVCSPARPLQELEEGRPGKCGEKAGRGKGRGLALTAPGPLSHLPGASHWQFPRPLQADPTSVSGAPSCQEPFWPPSQQRPCSLRSPGLGFHYLSPKHEPPCPSLLSDCCSGCLAALAFVVPTASLQDLGKSAQRYLHAESGPGLLSHHLVFTCHNTSRIFLILGTEPVCLSTEVRVPRASVSHGDKR